MTNASTQSHVADLGFVAGTSRGPRSLRTLALQMAQAERERHKEIGARIRDLRGRIPQPVIAERVGVTLRAYQAWEAGGGIAWDNLVRLAEVFGVSEDYIEYGAGGEYRPGTSLDRIEAKLDRIIEHLGLDDPGVVLGDLVTDLVGQDEPAATTAPDAPRTARSTGAKKATPRVRRQGKKPA